MSGPLKRIASAALMLAASAAFGQLPACPNQWTGLGGADGPVHALAWYDDGTGVALYAGGEFTSIGGIAASGIARWNGSTWSGVGGGMTSVGSYQPPSVRALAVYDDGTGAALFAAGRFTHAGAAAALRIARWDGAQWSPLSSGLDFGQAGLNAQVEVLAVANDGTGNVLCAGGDFASAGGLAASHVARWNGLWWTPFGSGTGDVIHAMAVFDSGAGPQLHVGGQIGPVVRWTGATWATVGPSGMTGGSSGIKISALVAADLGQGPRLYAGGDFTSAAGTPASRIAVWDGVSWQALGTGLGGPVLSISSWNDGSGNALYAAGSFTAAGAIPCNRVAKWNVAWSALGTGATGSGSVYGDALLAGTTPNALYLGGSFASVGGASQSGHLARWNSPVPSLVIVQPSGAGSPSLVTNGSLAPGHEYYNVISLSPCPGGLGSGPYGGLCFPDPTILVWEVGLPVGATPFHFVATAASTAFGPYALSAGLAVEALTADVTGGTVTCVSAPIGYVVY